MKSIWNNIRLRLKSLSGGGGRPLLRVDLHELFAVLLRLFLIVLFAVLQTTVFARFRLFGAVPDLMLATVLAIAIKDKAVRGAAYGIFAGFIIDSLGAIGFSGQPLFLGAIGFFAGYFADVRFSDNVAVRAIYILLASLVRSVFTLFMCALTINGFILSEVLTGTVIPEFAATLIFSAIPFFAVWICTKNRGERKDGDSE